MESGELSFFIKNSLKWIPFKKRSAQVLDLVLPGDLFGDKGIEATKEMVKKEVRKTFTAWRLCMAKDTTHQGCLNLQGIEAVFQVE